MTPAVGGVDVAGQTGLLWRFWLSVGVVRVSGGWCRCCRYETGTQRRRHMRELAGSGSAADYGKERGRRAIFVAARRRCRVRVQPRASRYERCGLAMAHT